MAATREKRVNAGNKMARLLNEEEEDDFYKTTYGGFDEVEQDNDYMEEDEAEDEVDSDFSIDENDEPVTDTEQEGPKKKRRLVTKAYKEPKPATLHAQSTPKEKKIKPKQDKIFIDSIERKSIRRSTAAKSAATQKRLRERNEDQKRKTKVVKHDVWKPTQEELLEEALQTEELNTKSLEKYQKLENEKKTTRTVRKTNVGPTIRYQSLSMPVMVLSETCADEEKINVECDDEKTGNSNNTVSDSSPKEGSETESKADGKDNNKEESTDTALSAPTKKKDVHAEETGKFYERTFITFQTEQSYQDVFKKSNQPRPPLKPLCAITRLPAKYLDPMTQLPYKNIQTFRLLREAYYQQLEGRTDLNDASQSPELTRWLEWRQKNHGNSQRNTIRLESASLPVSS
ncbi:PREDICTED: vacuolar protein sorting-associated protein 72 homolog [Wasmannia auropunctata]|uniref:vacuolar protein sorting-associated protein 72 homolog n=1 Tax=Wasmannia auropunctata TaxID=64793 RepID=UPI0005EF0F56|nr:PREDICTED: vacuolar protein sorting-associated protein 72 homolog [Wasmannia auropunctata]XP_011691736.1 PREDICTED: vacuolar protein sorting-associated protein 72 homolog [Wasmannia auropunctata]XP_011691737.1 PREDICTED: vacuolar protein sorting-associated protein 72 homolog [Wasmannia auropunctata]XP_011691738.1 PREDICTED: vacuolar protein sorting-associated protein 72 homolog [Wasmannia auropunctata]